MSKGTLLVIEPDFDIRNMLENYFSEQGYDVTSVKTGREGLSAVRRLMPDMVLIETELPDMSGYNVYHEIRKQALTRHIPIIILTSINESTHAIEHHLNNCDSVKKPFALEALKLHIEDGIAQSKRRLSGKHKILVVDEDEDIRKNLDAYFTGKGYEVVTVKTGEDALTFINNELVDLIILAIKLPNMNGYDVCRALRTNDRTKHIHMVFLEEKKDTDTRWHHRELGSDDYLSKPLNMEHLSLRVRFYFDSLRRGILINPVSNFPTGEPIEEHLRELMGKDDDWSYIAIVITDFEPFNAVYGWQAADEVLRATALMIVDSMEVHGTQLDFAGHPGNNYFAVITRAESTDALIEAIQECFTKEIQAHYSFLDSERGYILADGEQKALMTLSIGVASTRIHEFSDIRHITELADDDRRRRSGEDAPDNDGSDIPW